MLVDGSGFTVERRGNTVVFQDGQALTITPLGGGRFRVDDGARSRIGLAAAAGDRVWTAIDDESFECRLVASATSASPPAGSGLLTSPMPATVTALPVYTGQSVEAGDVLVALEAMKMELPLRAPQRSVVRAIHCRVGEIVPPDTVLVELDPS